MDDDPKQIVLQTADPNTLVIPKLKSLLAACGVTLPTNQARKAEYVKLFNELKEKLLLEQSRSTPSRRQTSSVVSSPPHWNLEERPGELQKSPQKSSPILETSKQPQNVYLDTVPRRIVTEEKPQPQATYSPKESSDVVSNILAYVFHVSIILAWCMVAAFLVTFFLQYPKYCEPGRTQGCIPCPQHGNCIDGQLKCMDTYVPVNGKCVKDTKLEKAANELITLLATYLQQKHGRSVCGQEASAWATEQEVVTYLIKSTRLISSTNDPVWQRAKSLISTSDMNIISHEGKFFTNEFILPFWCNVQFQLWNLKYYFGALLLVIMGVLYLMRWNRMRQYENELAQKLVQDCYGILMEQKSNYLHGHATEPFVVKSHIRDFLLKPPLSKVGRQRWEKVVGIIKSDSRVQCTIWSSHGEQQDVWEWTAPLISSVH